tara:strand:- start:291 stop:473 length:183 start_codon:yes stop_codon:yes gene_type:complete
MTLEKIIKEVEDEHDNIAYVYIKDGKEFFTPNLRVALKRNESNTLVIIDNGKIVKEIEIY